MRNSILGLIVCGISFLVTSALLAEPVEEKQVDGKKVVKQRKVVTHNKHPEGEYRKKGKK